MANREELAIIRNARAGQVAAQLELGKLYLFGSAGLPQSLPTALHWLERAARQDCPPAWQLIGNHIPLELAQHNAGAVAQWYERAYDDGSLHAGLVFAQLVLDPAAAPSQQHPKAVRALEDAARAGFPHAQWLLSQRQGRQPAAQPGTRAAPPSGAAQPASAAGAAGRPPARPPVSESGQERSPRPPGAGVAQYAALDEAWTARRWDDYLERALPQARALVSERGEQGEMRRFAPDEITLLSRCARLIDPALDGVSGLQALDAGAAAARCQPGEPAVFWELAAAEHDAHAQLALGLRCARMRVDGRRCSNGQVADAHVANAHVANAHVANAHVANAHVANFKKAIRWLNLAGEQGLAEAWYALSRIYIKPEFSQRNVADAQRYLQRAAEMGYRDAQLECGHNAWRARRENENNDVRAVYWLQKAAAQGSHEAVELLRKIAPRATAAPYTETGRLLASHTDALAAHPLLAARIELAALFGLSRAEALLLDVGAADQGHCLVIDIRASYGRSKRRLVMVESAQEREALDRIVRLFEQVDCGPAGPEGNYRQRLYRLRTLLNVAIPGNDADGGADIELAA
ncbi:SEL1-like repeat protein [Massilia sp. NP310]|uniref:tetratricopeptide repeat protein n=1 Tax=Massilia sp. NP310 TaxID=2861282 RepID=UPI001C62E046|nr:SEL1-like repeat protein [Massilia sp. NP310]QYG00587.1 SEL1-like repeat protein [Massilia sp. NP310]